MNPNALKAYHAKKRAIERKKYSKEAMNYFGKQYWNGLNKNNKAKIYMESTPTTVAGISLTPYFGFAGAVITTLPCTTFAVSTGAPWESALALQQRYEARQHHPVFHSWHTFPSISRDSYQSH